MFLSLTYTVRRLAPDALSGPLLEPALTVFAAALGFPPDHPRVRGMADAIRRHARRAGFRAFGAFGPDHQLVGFAYGFTSQPGSWWREQIAPALSPEERAQWLADAFELAELHVHPGSQGRKLGSQLHDALLADVPHRTALLSVMHRSDRARILYQRRGWQTLVEDLRFSSDTATPFSVMGLELAANSRPGAAAR